VLQGQAFAFVVLQLGRAKRRVTYLIVKQHNLLLPAGDGHLFIFSPIRLAN